jgi:hypothetical protein
MFIKELPHLTLRDLLEEEVPATRTFTVPASEIAVHTHGDTDDAIRIGAKDYPFTETGLLALGQFIGIPSTFLAERLPRDLVDTVVNRMLSVQGGDIDVAVTDSGLQDVFAPNGRRLDPHQVLEVAARVMNADDQVVGWRRNNQGYSFEVIEAFLDHQVTEVNDISRGGLRFGQETKHNEAPWVQPYIYRLLCTNGMEIPDETLKVTSQGRTIEELLEDLEASATAAFARVGNDIDSFYHLKEQRGCSPREDARSVRQGAGVQRPAYPSAD